MLEMFYGGKVNAQNDDTKTDMTWYESLLQTNSVQKHAFLGANFGTTGFLAVYNNRIIYVNGDKMSSYNFATPPVFEETVTLNDTTTYGLNGSVFQYGADVWFGQSRSDSNRITHLRLDTKVLTVYPATPVTKGMFWYYNGYVYITGGFEGTVFNEQKVWKCSVKNPVTGWTLETTLSTKLPTVLVGGIAYLYKGKVLFCGGGKLTSADISNSDGSAYSVIPMIDLTTYAVSSVTSTIPLRHDYHNPVFINGDYLSEYVYEFSGGNAGKTTYIGVNLLTGAAKTSNLGTQLSSYHMVYFQVGQLGWISGGYGGSSVHVVKLPTS